jgi:hypothetical protein
MSHDDDDFDPYSEIRTHKPKRRKLFIPTPSVYAVKRWLLVVLAMDAGYLVYETAQLVQRLGQ